MPISIFIWGLSLTCINLASFCRDLKFLWKNEQKYRAKQKLWKSICLNLLSNAVLQPRRTSHHWLHLTAWPPALRKCKNKYWQTSNGYLFHYSFSSYTLKKNHSISVRRTCSYMLAHVRTSPHTAGKFFIWASSTKYEQEQNHRKNSLVSRSGRHKRKPENEAGIRKTEEPSKEEKRTESQCKKNKK